MIRCIDVMGYERWLAQRRTSAGIVEDVWDWGPTDRVLLIESKIAAEFIAHFHYDRRSKENLRVWVEKVELDVWEAAVALVMSDVE